jgi:hypothetical protein
MDTTYTGTDTLGRPVYVDLDLSGWPARSRRSGTGDAVRQNHKGEGARW